MAIKWFTREVRDMKDQSLIADYLNRHLFTPQRTFVETIMLTENESEAVREVFQTGSYPIKVWVKGTSTVLVTSEGGIAVVDSEPDRARQLIAEIAMFIAAEKKKRVVRAS
jgi:hypothetical protein